jgi:formylglycine-generating enzyme required for sulfatase activity
MRELDSRTVEGVPTHPVVWVSWYDAMDYGRWLTTQIRTRGVVDGAQRVPTLVRLLREGDATSGGQPWAITLPSEAEWAQGPRGPTNAWRYPWGDEWDPNRANGLSDVATSIRTTSAVGCYPGGASPTSQNRTSVGGRIEELSGNAYEWTRSLWNDYPYEPDYDGRSIENVRASQSLGRVVRGGSFNGNASFLRSASRNAGPPTSRSVVLGFRVVASPFPLDS